MPEWLTVVVLGIIEGITEFLPISSTGHLLLAEHLFPFRRSDAFLVTIQSGAAAAVLLVFHERVRRLVTGWNDPESRSYLLKLVAAFAVTAVGGIILELLDFQLPETSTPVALALIVGGVLFIAIERWLPGRPVLPVVSWQMALAMGAAQIAAAVFPGISRAGATILIALAMGLHRRVAIEFSFLLGVPTLLAAGALSMMDALRHPAESQLDVGMLVLGSIVSAVTAFIAVRWLVRYLRSNTFVGFGWYRIALGILVLVVAALR